MDTPVLSNHFVVEMEGCDRIEAEKSASGWQLKVIGCHPLLTLLSSLKKQYGMDLTQWKEPDGNGHDAMLVRELILRARGEWNYPYLHEELCHCRMVPTKVVDRAILLGAHTPPVVSRRTSASTACGTCRPDVEKIIAYRLKKSA